MMIMEVFTQQKQKILLLLICCLALASRHINAFVPTAVSVVVTSPRHHHLYAQQQQQQQQQYGYTHQYSSSSSSSCSKRRLTLLHASGSGSGSNNDRENEIRKKIMQLKQEGKIKSSPSDDQQQSSSTSSSSTSSSTSSSSSNKNSNVIDQYADKIQAKMGKGKSKLLSKMKPQFRDAILSSSSASSSTITTKKSQSSSTSTTTSSSSTTQYDDIIDNMDDDQDFKLDEDEEEILERVKQKLLEQSEKQFISSKSSTSSSSSSSKISSSSGSSLGPDIDDIANQMEQEIEAKKQQSTTSPSTTTTTTQQQQQQQPIQKTTTGIGGTWQKQNTTAQQAETYRPANGGWGYFPRPKDISKAYGGGKKIERTSTLEDEQRKQNSVQDTRERLRQYREKVGIEVQSEKDHAQEIEEALALGQLAMSRGVYNTAVSSLEKVTKYCSTNSKVGSRVFLELAMAYEAVGRTSEAIQVYNALSDSRMEDVKFNAKRLLYGIESMKFMREEVKSEAFSRKKVKQTFIDTTGLADIAQNFDEKIYNTAYIDLDKGGNFYRKLTESVVRSIREARQILLRATDSGEVERTKIVQALRSIERKFNEALKEEIKRNKPKEEPIAVMNGKPIVKTEDMESQTATAIAGMDSLNLGDIQQTLENVSGEWKLQLMADSKGDGVNFFNKTLSWQYFDIDEMNYDASGPAGFLKVTQSGEFEIDKVMRVISRKNVKNEGSGAFLTDLLGTSNLSGSMAATNLQQQIISVDSELLITRVVVDGDKRNRSDTVRDYFSVWRRAETGLYSRQK